MGPARLFKARGDGVGIQMGEWPGEGGAVLCLHGLTANLRCFDLTATGLAGAHRVLAMDLRGRGLSDKPDSGYSLDHHCRDIRAVLEDLGLAKVALLGHSLGAFICLGFAARYPEMADRLVLLDGGAELTDQQWLKVGDGIQSAVDRLGVVSPSFAAYLDQVRRSPFFSPWNSCMEAYFRYESEEVSGGVRSRVKPEHIAEERANLRLVKPSELYPKVQCPVLVLRAAKGMLTDDGLVLPVDAADRMVQSLASAKLVNLEGVDHYSIVFQPNRRRDQAILDFLAA